MDSDVRYEAWVDSSLAELVLRGQDAPTTAGGTPALPFNVVVRFRLGGRRLSRRAILLEPDAGILFDRGDLCPGQPGAHKWGQGFAGVVAVQAGYCHPEVSAVGVLRNSAAAVIDGT